MSVLNEMIEQLALEFTNEHPDLPEEKITGALSNAIEESLPQVTEMIFNSVIKSVPDILPLNQADVHGFVKRNTHFWQEGLDLLEVLNYINFETGELVWQEWRHTNKNMMCKCELLRRLHVKSCQVATETICLLKNGLADGALARWRTLHESATITVIIAENDDSLAERFIDYHEVERWKKIKLYQTRAPDLGYKLIPKQIETQSKKKYDDVIQKYGAKFGKAYGWASEIIPKAGNVTFFDIERYAAMDSNKPYYKWACEKIHVSCNSLYHSLGNNCNEELLIAGHSNLGLSDPAILTAITISQMIDTLVATVGPHYDLVIHASVARRLAEKIEKVFYSLQKKMDKCSD